MLARLPHRPAPSPPLAALALARSNRLLAQLCPAPIVRPRTQTIQPATSSGAAAPSSSAVAARLAARRRMAAAASAASTETIDLQELLSVCVDLAAHADSGKLHAVDKDANSSCAGCTNAKVEEIVDPQTMADLESQRIIIGNLQRIYGSGLRIVGEEGELDNAAGPDGVRVRDVRRDALAAVPFPPELRSVPMRDVALWVDPLDGTKEFTLGYVHYVTVLIGVSVRGRAVGGVVHVPFTGGKYERKHDPLNSSGSNSSNNADSIPAHRPPAASVAPQRADGKVGQTIWGAVGAGVFGVQRVADEEIPAGRRFITTTRTHFSPALAALLEQMKPQQVIRCGGAGSKGLLVLSREADAYVYPQGGTKRWDTCAIEACIKAVGGKFTDQYGDDIVYDPDARYENDKGLLATMNSHEQYLLPKPNTQA